MEAGGDEGMPEVDHAAILLYRWMLVQGGLATSALPRAAAETGLTEEECAAALRLLTDSCLVQAEGEGWQAVSPQAAGARLLSGPEASLRAHEEQLQARRDELQRRRDAFTGLIPVYLQARQHAFPQGTIDHLADQFAVRALLTEVIDNCREEVLVSKHGGSFPEAALREALPRDLALLERGVRMRSLYQHATRFDPATRTHTERLIEAGAEVRTLPEVLPQMIIVDGELGFLPSRSGGALLIREPDLLGYLLDVFDRDWEYATPFATGPQAAHDISETVKRSILTLLAKGLKDDSIARRLGISLRTCRRHVSELLLGLGAHSRFQAGVIAERQGLTQTPRSLPEQAAPAPATDPEPEPEPATTTDTTTATDPATAEPTAAGPDGPSRCCPGCGAPLQAAGGRRPVSGRAGRPARHCSAACRARAYRARRRPGSGETGPADSA
ncbi:helix-turn-helix transcriptional regulator [Streptomyces sp. WM6372]|uniref:helix-turn-helix transcriptional regulator n=1 Tax=Streptomyces sp. WM6372 TaxID=1415555 RepID=UPI0006B00DD0|nr:LuxR C-terminal-related transcriptional regulator [Streptomyces sp. WM6372]